MRSIRTLTFSRIIATPIKPKLDLMRILIIKVTTPKIAEKNIISQRHSMGTKDTLPINKLTQWVQMLLFSKRNNCSHKVLKISRKKALPLLIRTLLWANLRGPQFSRISRTITISIIIYREGVMGESSYLASRIILLWIIRQAVTTSIICSPTNLCSLNRSYCQSRNRSRDRWNNIRIELIHHL